MFSLLAGGYYVENLPSFLKWVEYLSPLKYAFDALLYVEFDHSMPCDNGECEQT
jgi:ABC-type multidrug transport system permease subunit